MWYDVLYDDDPQAANFGSSVFSYFASAPERQDPPAILLDDVAIGC